jgi:sulfur-carrier protein adenylyltransferase/sulfurtransferase
MNSARYSSQTILPQVGVAGQQQLKSVSVLCVGSGGLGCACLYYLVAAGVGNVTIVDADIVDVSNLQRQILFSVSDIGKLKVTAAKDRLLQLNPEINITTIASTITAANASAIVQGHDLIVAATDSLATSFLLNDLAIKVQIPLVYAAANKFTGQLAVFDTQLGACLRCLYPDYPRSLGNCASSGILGALVGMLGSMQALEAIKLLLTKDNAHSDLLPLVSKLLTIDATSLEISKFHIAKDQTCAVCTLHSQSIVLQDYLPAIDDTLAIHTLSKDNNFTLIDVRSCSEWQYNALPTAINIPLNSLSSDQLQQLLPPDKSAAYLIYCHTDTRSRQALSIFRDNGFTNVRYLAGGLAKLQLPNTS